MLFAMLRTLLTVIALFNLAFAGSLNHLKSSNNDREKIIPHSFPLFKQCDAAWGNDLMGDKTVCSVGCLMSSTAMGLAGKNIPIDAATNITSNPGTLNSWLKANDGYSNNNLIETQVPLIDPKHISWPEDAFHTTNDLPYITIASYINKGRIVIANVNAGGHFVLLTGYNEDGDTFFVNDPGYDRTTYSYKTDVVGYRIFDMAKI